MSARFRKLSGYAIGEAIRYLNSLPARQHPCDEALYACKMALEDELDVRYVEDLAAKRKAERDQQRKKA